MTTPIMPRTAETDTLKLELVFNLTRETDCAFKLSGGLDNCHPSHHAVMYIDNLKGCQDKDLLHCFPDLDPRHRLDFCV